MLEDRRLCICHYLPTVAIAICANSAGTIARNIFAIYTTNRHSDYAANADAGCVPPKPRVLVFEQLVTSELNTFFPFDPYKLPRSGSYIQGVYREWSSVAIDDEDEEEEDEDEDEEGDEQDGERR